MSDREIRLPFGVDGQGRVATTSDPDVAARQHLETYLLTSPGERVQRHDFGTPLLDTMFENVDPLTMQLLTTRVADKVARDVRGVTLAQLTATEGSQPGELTLTVGFRQAVGQGAGQTRTTELEMGGQA